MPNKSKGEKDWKESPSGKHGDQNKSQDRGSGNKDDKYIKGQLFHSKWKLNVTEGTIPKRYIFSA